MINLILAFAVATKHKLRHEYEYDYPDLLPLIGHLDTFSRSVHEEGGLPPLKPYSALHRFAMYFGIPFFKPDFTKRTRQFHRSGKNNGHLPLEIMSYIDGYTDLVVSNNSLYTTGLHGPVLGYQSNMINALTGCERILTTPLPLAYNILLSQITWLYVCSICQ